MSADQYSPYVSAALKGNPTLAPVARVRADERFIPPIQSQAARDLLYVDPFADLPQTPRKPLQLVGQPTPEPMFGELKNDAIADAQNAQFAATAHVSASALWAANLQSMGPGSLEAALTRIDKLEERMHRFRVATGLPQEVFMRHRDTMKLVNVRLPKSLIARMEQTAAERGDIMSQTHRFLIEAGLILIEERARQYQVWVLEQSRIYAAKAAQLESDAVEKREAVVEVMTELEVDRYVDTESESFKRALLTVDPLHGAPPAVRELLRAGDAPRMLSA